MISSRRVLGFSAGILTLILLIMVVWIIRYSQERARVNELRHHVFCEQITPGMSLFEVRRIIAQYGNFRETESSFKSGLFAVGIYFNDPTTNRQFGQSNIVLVFENGKYIDTRVPVPLSDSYRSLCR
jgi:hypothetical protein